MTHKIWKELKWEIKEVKEVKEHLKIETDGLKLVIEDLRKINEGDWRERFGDQGWGEVIHQLITRSDQVEGELRSFISGGERPETGVIPVPMPAEPPDARPPYDHNDGEGRGGSRGRGRRQ